MSDNKEEVCTPLQEELMKKCFHVQILNGPIRFVLNPVVSLLSFIIIWIFVILCIAYPDEMLYSMSFISFTWIPEVWTWLYIVSQDIWIVVLIYLMILPRYGNMKLSGDEEVPEYSFPTWFSMLFSAGVAVGLFYYSVSEPIWHYTGSGRYTTKAKGYGNSNEDASMAIVNLFYHWGVHGWIPYTTMGAVLAIMSHRRGYPMTIRYCFYPLIKDRCYGWMGDFVDVISIMTTIFGVCTSLGLGAIQVNAGMQRLSHGFFRGKNLLIPSDPKYEAPTCNDIGSACAEGQESFGVSKNITSQILIILAVTILATCSVVSGMSRGIVNLSRINFAIGMGISLSILFLGETWFILDVIVQCVGYYMWYLIKLGFWTDAFERLGDMNMNLGGAPDSLGGSAAYMGGWVIFYWGWWISWAPFVGTFLAKISKGRTLRQFIAGTLLAPTGYSFYWLGIFGAEAIRMQRMGQGSGLCALSDDTLCNTLPNQGSKTCFAFSNAYTEQTKTDKGIGWNPGCEVNPDHYGHCLKYVWERPVKVGSDGCTMSKAWVDKPCGAADPTAGSVDAMTELSELCKDEKDVKDIESYFNMFDKSKNPKTTEDAPPQCFETLPDNVVCLGNRGGDDMYFDLVSSYGPRGFSDLMCVVSMIALILYFVTSSDSGSLVVDIISANGHPNPPIPQRIAWSITEGATACALLASGQNNPKPDASLKALQACSIAMGLPYTFFLFWCAQALYLIVKEEVGEVSKTRKAFRIFIFEPGMENLKTVVLATFVPGLGMGQLVKHCRGWPFADLQQGDKIWLVLFTTMYWTAIIFLICAAVTPQWGHIGGVIYVGFGSFLGFLRCQVRLKFGIEHGDLLTDLICGICCPMLTITQMLKQLSIEGESSI